MSMTPFGTWLAEIRLGNYADVFAANKIDFDVIHQMTDADLRELGLALGDRKRLLQAIARLNGQSTTEVVTSGGSTLKPSKILTRWVCVAHAKEPRRRVAPRHRLDGGCHGTGSVQGNGYVARPRAISSSTT